jgi:hypothetical protein
MKRYRGWATWVWINGKRIGTANNSMSRLT